MLDHHALARYHASVAGAPYKPLREMPVVVTNSEARSYLHEIGSFLSSLKKDMTAYLIVDDASKDEDKAIAKLDAAEADDGCSLNVCMTMPDGTRSCDEAILRRWNGTGCPIMTEQEWMSTPETVRNVQRTMNKWWRAKEARLQAFIFKDRALRTYKNANDRNVSPIPQDQDVDLWNSVYDKGGLDERWFSMNDDLVTLYTSENDWKRIQSLDMDMQRARDQFAAITGRQPAMPLPTKEADVPEPKKASWESGLEGVTSLIKWGVIGVGVYYGATLLLPVVAGLRSKKSAPALPAGSSSGCAPCEAAARAARGA